MAQLRVLGTSPTGCQIPTSEAHEYISMESLPDDLKLRFFMENFDKISMDRLEKLLLPADKQKEYMIELVGEPDVSDLEGDQLIDELESRKYVVLKPENLHQEIYLESVTETLPTL